MLYPKAPGENYLLLPELFWFPPTHSLLTGMRCGGHASRLEYSGAHRDWPVHEVTTHRKQTEAAFSCHPENWILETLSLLRNETG